MKIKILLLLFLIGFFSSVSAQVCKISDSGDNVEVFGAYIENGNTVVVTVANDSKDISANVTVTVEVTYEVATLKEEFTGKTMAKPNQETIIKISIPEKKGTRRATSVKVKNITGAKCQ
jgi:hypothetical protein